EDIIRCGANEFFIYLHGHNAKIHDKITKTKGSFEQTIEGIKNLIDLNQNIHVRAMVTFENYKHLFDLFKLLSKQRMKTPHPQPIYTTSKE
ncbi:MAG: hypothetical protein ACE5HW_00855, partial [Candidatus Methanofastidiosia archaeon]